MTPKGQEKKTSADDAKFGSYGSGDEQRFQVAQSEESKEGGAHGGGGGAQARWYLPQWDSRVGGSVRLLVSVSALLASVSASALQLRAPSARLSDLGEPFFRTS